MTDDQKKLRMLALAHELKRIAAPIGAMHAYWDVLIDMDAFVKGKPTIIQRTADEWISEAEALLQNHK